MRISITFLSVVALLSACQQNRKTETLSAEKNAAEKGSFAYDVSFLRAKDTALYILKSADGKAAIAVSAVYQGKVFTSTADGDAGKSFGWINYKAFSGKPDEHMNGYGGEDRLWLGPEGNKYALFFKPGVKMAFADWHTPPAFDTEKWAVKSASDSDIKLQKDMSLFNYAGTTLQLRVSRKISMMEQSDIESRLGIELDGNLASVGFSTDNSIENTGKTAWTEKTGAPCLWNLDMFTPSPSAVIIIPYEEKASGKVATTDYFGQIPPDRVKTVNGILYLMADGKYRGKLGLTAQRAKTVAGSYDPENRVLTIMQFDIDRKATYLNQEWNTTSPALKGDAVNAYNDGPLEDGKQMGPFYEIESVSPAAFLKPGAKLEHNHCVFHFTGNEDDLDKISVKVLGASLAEVKKIFAK